MYVNITLNLAIIGTKKLAVLPLPVGAIAIKFLSYKKWYITFLFLSNIPHK